MNVTIRNTQTGQVGEVPEHVFNNPAIINPNVFVRVETGAKPYVPELYKSKTADEFLTQHSDEVEDIEVTDDYDTFEEDED